MTSIFKHLLSFIFFLYYLDPHRNKAALQNNAPAHLDPPPVESFILPLIASLLPALPSERAV